MKIDVYKYRREAEIVRKNREAMKALGWKRRGYRITLPSGVAKVVTSATLCIFTIAMTGCASDTKSQSIKMIEAIERQTAAREEYRDSCREYVERKDRYADAWLNGYAAGRDKPNDPKVKQIADSMKKWIERRKSGEIQVP